jgi:hypothetical protein
MEQQLTFPAGRRTFQPMKRLLLVLACAGFVSASAFAGSCGGCCGEKGKETDKGKEGEKGPDATKQSLVVVI